MGNRAGSWERGRGKSHKHCIRKKYKWGCVVNKVVESQKNWKKSLSRFGMITSRKHAQVVLKCINLILLTICIHSFTQRGLLTFPLGGGVLFWVLLYGTLGWGWGIIMIIKIQTWITGLWQEVSSNLLRDKSDELHDHASPLTSTSLLSALALHVSIGCKAWGAESSNMDLIPRDSSLGDAV